MYRVTDENRLQRLLPNVEGGTRRQDLPPIYALNGAIYIARIDWLKKTKSFVGDGTIAYQMPRERSIDIDTPDDFIAFRSIVEKR
jgi:CMP-N,N'-diacetyllegionaminic acid synthase